MVFRILKGTKKYDVLKEKKKIGKYKTKQAKLK